MNLVKKIGFSIIGISVIGSITHSIGQVIIAYFLLNTTSILYYLPYLLLFSVPAGIFTGLISKELIKYFKNN
jgi:heptaprenyl diphosphate synthase